MSRLQIKCFGDLRVELNGENVSNFETDKTRALLVYLALEAEHPLQRSHIAGILWSDEAEDRALHNLRQTLSSLRKALGDSASSPQFIFADRETIRLNPSADIYVDAKIFTLHLSQAYLHYQRQIGHGLYNIRSLQKAIRIYQGQFLSSFRANKCALFEEWLILKQEDYNFQAIKALALLAEYHEKRGEYYQAIQSALRVVEIAPWDETSRLQVIRLLGINKQWSAAKSQFFALKSYLSEQLAISPSNQTLFLYEKICEAAAGNLSIPPGYPPARFHLPEISSTLIGREVEMDEIVEQIVTPENRLITIIGPGGIGKTRLAVEIARQLVGVPTDGVFFISLITAQNSEQIIQLVASSMGFTFSDQTTIQKQFFDNLRDKELLLVLDNFEHLLKDTETTVLLDKILCQSPGVTILVTSRERLNLQQELLYNLTGLSYPQVDKVSIENVGNYDALNLFVSQVAKKQSHFALDENTLPIAVQICNALEGLPLGVELAASTISELGYEVVASKIAHDLDALDTTTTNIEPRHRSLHAAFEVSWDLLSQPQQEILGRLSVFPDEFGPVAASEITGATTADLFSLAAKSLLYRKMSGRYSFHEAIRHFVRKKSNLTENFTVIRERHALFYASFLAEKNDHLQSDEQTTALAEIQSEYANLNLAWHWLVDNKRAIELMRCMDSLHLFFSIRSYLQEGVKWFKYAVQNIQDLKGNELVTGMLLWRLGSLAYHTRENELAFSSLLRSQEILTEVKAYRELAFCWLYLGWAHQREKDFTNAQNFCQKSLEHFRSIGDILGQSYALTLSGAIQNRQGNNLDAKIFYDQALTLCRRSGNLNLLIIILNRLGDLACYEGHYEFAVKLFEECLEISKNLNDSYNQAILLNNLGTIYHTWNDYTLARSFYQRSLEICREIGDQDGLALALNNLGELSTAQGDYPAALKYSHDALQIAEQLQEIWTIIVCLNSLGEIYCALGQLKKSESYFLPAMRQALEINGIDLLARVSVNAAKNFQLLGDFPTAITLLQASLSHSSTEHDSRQKAVEWLKEMGADYEVANNDLLLVDAVKKILKIPAG